MSGFAELLHSAGFTISGSDMKETQITKHLETIGINILYGQSSKNITKNINLVVYTAAISEDNPEFMAAKEQNIPMIDRAEMVGQVMKNYKTPIAVSGTHGKTTTTSMISHLLLEADLDPTISVGGILKAIHGNLRIGKSGYFLTEACEYTNSFLKFNPFISVILNIEEDHLDFFKDINDIRHSFREFAKRLPKNGLLIINDAIENHHEIYEGLECNVKTFGLNKDTCNYAAQNITFNDKGFGEYDLYIDGKFESHIELSVVGEHNILNSLSAIAVGIQLGVSVQTIQAGLIHFHGTDRRFEYKGEVNGITIIDDYAHHPTEIEATLKAAASYPHKELWCAFQPHTYTRTRAFLKDFAKALSHADKVILADIYAAREKDPGDISSRDLLNELKKLGKETYYFPTFTEMQDFIKANCKNGDLLITMGAGDIVSVGENLLK
ncbi:UDP-N-acetylmuramate--alanine ligase [Lachnospiraceae bacterium KM106-2]|nr:UDP-N-acetylmuramate--alanine ligase [Lachnospiraceae bacterium KM106-2]